jgi:hypothetical protein
MDKVADEIRAVAVGEYVRCGPVHYAMVKLGGSAVRRAVGNGLMVDVVGVGTMEVADLFRAAGITLSYGGWKTDTGAYAMGFAPGK